MAHYFSWVLNSNHIYYVPLAQLVEHLTFNQRVEGSSPSWLTIVFCLAKYCGCGGIGRRNRLRIWRRKAWGFDSLHPHLVYFIARYCQGEEYQFESNIPDQ